MSYRSQLARVTACAVSLALLSPAADIVRPDRAGAQTTPSVSIAVPLYTLDKAAWDRAIKSPAVSWVVAHPDVVELGRPYAKNDTLVEFIASAKAAGKKVAVYNSARYDKEDWEPTADRADVLVRTYPNVDGIFFDEINYDQCSKYQALRAGAGSKRGFKDRHPTKLLMLNPGSPILACYEGNADVFLNMERAAADIDGWVQNVTEPNNVSAYSWMFKPSVRPQIWQMAHGVAPGQIETTIDRLLQNNASVIYVTTDTMPNPYDSLPSEDNFSRIERRVQEYASGRIPLPVVRGVGTTATTRPSATATPNLAPAGSTNGTPPSVTSKATPTTKKRVTKTTKRRAVKTTRRR